MKNRFQTLAVSVRSKNSAARRGLASLAVCGLCVSGTAILLWAQDAQQPAGDAPKSDATKTDGAKKQRTKAPPKPGVSTMVSRSHEPSTDNVTVTMDASACFATLVSASETT